MVTLKGKLITLRYLKKSDSIPIYKLITKRIADNTAGIYWPYSKKDAEKYINHAIEDNKKSLKNKKGVYFAIISNESTEVIGQTGFSKLNFIDKYAETSSWLGEKYWGKGINTEAKILLLNYGFNTLKLHKIGFQTFKTNIRSQKAIAKLDAKKEGVLRKHLYKQGKYHDRVVYSILKKDWKPSKIKKKYMA